MGLDVAVAIGVAAAAPASSPHGSLPTSFCRGHFSKVQLSYYDMQHRIDLGQ